MMKMKQIGAFLIILCMGVFAACSDSDDETPPIEPTDLTIEAQGTYKGNLNIKIPPIGQGEATDITEVNKIKLSRTDVNKITLELKDFSFTGLNVGDIVLSDLSLDKDGDKIVIKEASKNIKIMGGEIEATVAVTGTIENKKIDLSLKITKVLGIDEIKVGFKGDKMDVDNEKIEAKITKITFDSPHVVEQPTITGTSISLIIKPNLKPEDLKAIVVNLELSEAATSTPASGKTIDLSTGSAKIMVVAEDGIHKTEYTVTTTVTDKYMIYDMEEWYLVNTTQQTEARKYYAPVGNWTSSNVGVDYLMNFGGMDVAEKFCVTKSDNAFSGKSAARIETLDTKGAKIIAAIFAPRVTSGSFFLGKFKVESNRVTSSKFGVPFEKKPLQLKGHYKYKSGPLFLFCEDPNIYQTTIEKPNQKDKFAISAVLYEYDPIQAEKDETAAVKRYTTYLTGADLYDKTKYTAIAKIEKGDAAEYTEFSLDFEYVKDYDKTLSYRIAIVASSSKDGDKFSGAPGSVLYVDDLQIISE